MGLVLDLWEQIRETGEALPITMVGSSMWPALPIGSRLELRACAATELTPGDFVAFRRGRLIVTHRVVAVRLHDVLAWGDAVIRPDAPIPHEDVLGRVTVIERASPFAKLLPQVLVSRGVAAVARRIARAFPP